MAMPMNNGNRISYYQTKEEVQKLIDAALYAYCRGQPLNRFVTINFAQAGFTGDAHAAITTFCNAAGAWLLRHSGKSACYFWVLENAPGAGLHVHIGIHVPEDLRKDYLERQRGWLKAAGIAFVKRVLKSKRIKGSETLELDLPRYLGKGLRGLTLYFAKGLEPSQCEEFGVRHKPQGIIIGKRCGFSATLGSAQRAMRGPRVPGRFVFYKRGPEWWRQRVLVHHGYFLGLPDHYSF
jgi:hypothetical protein